MANQITGRIYWIGATETITGKSGKSINKRLMWLTPFYFDRYTGEPTAAGYDESIEINFSGERCAELDKYQAGQDIVVTFDIRGRVYQNAAGENRNATSVEGKFVRLAGQQAEQQPVAEQAPQANGGQMF
mgnify:CR=1 FL=1